MTGFPDGLVRLSDTASYPVKIDTLYTGNFRCRSIQADGDRIWFATDGSRYGYLGLTGKQVVEFRLPKDSMDIRSLYVTKKAVFLLNAGSPARLYQTELSGKNPQLRFEDKGKEAFFDGIRFWNDKEGLALGDPVNGCFRILITRDGGLSWTETNCGKLPATEKGEAAFAASNSSISIIGNQAWIASGGSHSRIFHTADKGKSWNVFPTPITKGEGYTGIYTSDFYDAKTGFVAGGDYSKPESDVDNKAITLDGGKTWKIVAQNRPFGYASCVRFVPGSKGKKLLCVGAMGIFYSRNAGQDWELLHKDYDLYVLHFADSRTAYAAGKNHLVRITLPD